MSFFALLKMKVHKDWKSVQNAVAHNMRTRNVQNASGEGAEINLVLADGGAGDVFPLRGDGRGTTGPLFAASPLIVELIAGVTLPYFRQDESPDGTAGQRAHLFKWAAAAHTWSKTTFGDKLKCSTLHLDEGSPHIHMLVLPMAHGGELSLSCWFAEGNSLAALKSSYASALAHLGIMRPIEPKFAEGRNKRLDFYPGALMFWENLKCASPEDFAGCPAPPLYKRVFLPKNEASSFGGGGLREICRERTEALGEAVT